MLPSQCLVGKPLSRCRAFVVSLSRCVIAKAFLVHLPRPLPSPSASCLRSPCSVAKPLFMSPNPCLVAEPLLPAAESLVIVLMLLSPSPSYRALLTLACQVLPAEPLFSVAKPAFIHRVAKAWWSCWHKTRTTSRWAKSTTTRLPHGARKGSSVAGCQHICNSLPLS